MIHLSVCFLWIPAFAGMTLYTFYNQEFSNLQQPRLADVISESLLLTKDKFQWLF